MCILGNRNTGTLIHCEAHPRCYSGSGAENNETQEERKIETKVQKDRQGSNRQPSAGNESTQKIGRAPRIPQPGAGPDKQAGLGAKPLSTCFSGFKSQDSIFPSFNSLPIKCRKYYL